MKTQLNVKMYLILVVLLTFFSCNGFAQEDKTPTRTKTFELNQPGTLNARSSGGGIKVKSHQKEEVVIQLFIRKNGRILSPSDPMVDEVLDLYDLEIEKNGSEITAIAKRKSNFNLWKNTGISITIYLPSEVSCNVSSSGGGVKIDGVKGTHKFSSSGGSVKLENVSGTIRAKSSGGRVKAVNIDGDIHLSSSGGSVSVDEAKGNIYAHSSGGGVHLENIKGEADASSSGGGVSVSGECNYVKAKSSGGSVRVNISKLSKELYLQSSGGGVDAVIKNGENLGLDLDLSSQKVKIDLNNFTGRADKDRIKGKMNNGGIPVYMRASGGNVNVRFEE